MKVHFGISNTMEVQEDIMAV